MWDDPINLIEHHTCPVPQLSSGQLAGLERYLDEVWQTRTLLYDDKPDQSPPARQPFLKFGYDPVLEQLTMKAGQYVGFIQYEGITIQILPKLFRKDQADTAFRHLLWWMEYSQRVRFPFSDLLTGDETIHNFPEALIRYFARFAYQQVSAAPYYRYEEMTETMPFLRGRLNTQEYINSSLSRGNWHQLVCDHEPFQFNNRLNQIIKFVARRLSHQCRYPDTQRDLERVVFILDEVDDVPCTVHDCNAIQLNRFFQGYEHCVDMCRFFLTDQYLNRQNDQERHFCFLVPMDMVYEDFIAGVVKTHLGHHFKVQTQAVDYLAKTGAAGRDVFRIRNDLLLTDKRTTAITVVDTKYKVRKYDPTDPKTGISQTDLYQMVSYALRRDTRQVVLLYPVSCGRVPAEVQTFAVTSGLFTNPGQPIHIGAVDLTVTGQVNTRDEFNQQVVEGVLLPQLTQAFNQTNS